MAQHRPLSERPPRPRWRRRELAYGVLLVLVAAVVYGPHIRHGGFAWDDWMNAANALVPGSHKAPGGVYLRELVYEPGLAIALALPYFVFGLSASWHLALAVLLGVAFAASVFALAREFGLKDGPALAIAALTLIFPWSDSVRLWATAGINQLAAIAYVAGLTVALREFRAEDAVAARRLRRTSIALYAVSVLTYAVAVLPIALSTLIYRARAPWRAAWRRGRIDLLLAVVASAYVALTTTKPIEPLGRQASHAGNIVGDWVALQAHALVPLGGLPAAGAIGAGVLAGLAAVALWAPAHRRWALYGLAGAAASLVTYLVFVTGEPKYTPLAPGLYNRVGMMAAPALALTVFATVALVAGAILPGPRRRRARSAFTYGVVVLIAVGWAATVRRDARLWDRAADQSRVVLATLARAAPNPADGSIVYVSGIAPYVADGVPVFASSFDLNNAFMLVSRNRAVHAFAVTSPIVCGYTRMAPAMWPYRTRQRARYGRPWMVDAQTGVLTQINSRDACLNVADARGLGHPPQGLTADHLAGWEQ